MYVCLHNRPILWKKILTERERTVPPGQEKSPLAAIEVQCIGSWDVINFSFLRGLLQKVIKKASET